MLVIDQDRIDAVLSWPSLIDALDEGHRLGRGQTCDVLLEEGRDILLSRGRLEGRVRHRHQDRDRLLRQSRPHAAAALGAGRVRAVRSRRRPAARRDRRRRHYRLEDGRGLGAGIALPVAPRCPLPAHGRRRGAGPAADRGAPERAARDREGPLWNWTPARAEALAAELRPKVSRSRSRPISPPRSARPTS